MVRLNVHIVGAGAVGLATGYLLSRQGHSVVHQSVRGRSVTRLLVRGQIEGFLRDAEVYRPHFISGKITPADYVIFAGEPGIIATFLDSMADHAWLDGAGHVLLASVIDPEWRAICRKRPFFRPQLAFPIMSCELSGGDELNLVTDMQMDLLEPQSAAEDGASLGRLWENSHFRSAETVSIGRFAARYLLTAAVYINLLAIHRGRLVRADVSAPLLRATLGDLVAWFEHAFPRRRLDFPMSAQEGLTASAELIRTSSDCSNLLQRNICALLNEGAPKLEAHLRQLHLLLAHRASPHANRAGKAADLEILPISKNYPAGDQDYAALNLS